KFAADVSPDGRYIVFATDRSGGTIWRMDIDGSNPKQLTPDDGQDSHPVVSPDGQWILFDSYRSGKPTLWKVSIDGGKPLQLTDKISQHAAVSPDGKTIAGFFLDERGKTELALLPFSGGDFVKLFDLPDSVVMSGGLKWTPDGQAVAFIDQRNPSNIVK